VVVLLRFTDFVFFKIFLISCTEFISTNWYPTTFELFYIIIFCLWAHQRINSGQTSYWSSSLRKFYHLHHDLFNRYGIYLCHKWLSTGELCHNPKLFLFTTYLVAWVCVAPHFSFRSCVVCLCFVCLRPVSYVSTVASVYGSSILNCSFGLRVTRRVPLVEREILTLLEHPSEPRIVVVFDLLYH